MKKKYLIILILVAAIVAYPVMRLNRNANLFADSLLRQAGALGVWTYGDAHLSLDGKVSINNLSFTPNGFQQGFDIGYMEIHTDIWYLLRTSEREIATRLPSNLSIFAKNVGLNRQAGDLKASLVNDNYWPVVSGYLGAFGCGEEGDRFFSVNQWDSMIGSELTHDVEVNYINTGNFGLDFSIGVDTKNMWYTSWSGTLELIDNSANFTIQDGLADQLYYTFIDRGFNQKRNTYCAQKHRDSFQAFRLHSAERLQQLLRVMVGQEMPETVSNWYQRSLNPDVEINAIYNLESKQYFSALLSEPQESLLSQGAIEVAIDDGDYNKVDLKKVSFLAMDPELLRDQYEQKERKEKERLAELNKPKELIKVVRTTIGGEKKGGFREVKNWQDAVGSKVRVKTNRGRPIFGRLKQVNSNEIIMSNQYLTGSADISVKKKNILSMSWDN